MSAGKRYQWTNKSYEAKVSAAVFGEWLERLPDKNPETIVKHAQASKSPAHRLFTWSDTQAAREFRLIQARMLLGSFVIETIVTTKGRKDKTIIAPYVSRCAPGHYEVTTVAMGVSKKRQFMLAAALKQLNRWRQRYAALSELAVVFSAIDEVDAQNKRRRA